MGTICDQYDFKLRTVGQRGLSIRIVLLIFFIVADVASQSKGAEESSGAKSSGSAKSNGYALLSSKKLNLELQIATQQKVLEDLIHHKNSTRDVQAKNQAVEEMTKAHADLRAAIDSYNKVLKDLNYHFPEKGDSSERKYLPLKNKSIEQIEEEMGLDAELTRVKEKIHEKYASFEINRDSKLKTDKNSESGEQRGSARNPSNKESRPQLVK